MGGLKQRVKLRAGIISWSGVSDRAAAIAADLLAAGLEVTVVYSNDAGAAESGPGTWVRCPNDEFFGHKFAALLRHVPQDDGLLLVQADVDVSDWNKLVAHCQQAFAEESKIGLWIPRIDNTPFALELTSLGRLRDGSGLYKVLQTDAIVVAMVPAVVHRLREIQIGDNNYGWGIDWLAVTFAFCNGLLAVCDTGIAAHHPRSRGYNSDDAETQMGRFLGQLQEAERTYYEAIRAELHLRVMYRTRSVHMSNPAHFVSWEPPAQPFPDIGAAGLESLVMAAGQIFVTADEAASPTLAWDGGGTPLQPDSNAEDRTGSALVTSFRYVQGESWTFAPNTDGDFGCQGQETGKFVAALHSPSVSVALIDSIDLPATLGPVVVHMGIAVHRADADLQFVWSAVAAETDAGEAWVKVDPAFDGAAALSNFQPVRVEIPQTGVTRRLEIRLRYWGTGSTSPDHPSVLFITRPVILTGPLADETITPLVLTSERRGDRLLAAPLPSVPASVELNCAGTRLPLIAAPRVEIDLALREGQIELSATRPMPAVLSLQGHNYRMLWLEPTLQRIDLPPGLVRKDSVEIEVRDASGTMVLTRITGHPRTTDVIPEVLRHPDCWIVEPLFDTEFYRAGFPADDVPADPVSHYLESGWIQGRDPAPWFSTWHYLAHHRDVTHSGINPFVHFCRRGRQDDPALGQMARRGTLGSETMFAEMFSATTGSRSPHFAPLTDRHAALRPEGMPRILAFYLPQFHPFPENDAWWGRGFTEWTNVTKALPQFSGHYQPRLAGELGYYDLRMPEVMARQIELARQYGVHGFCFHYYWFSGHRLLERPLDQFLERQDAAFDFPFCLCWANENWTRRWDGAEHDVLMRQNHGPDDHAAVFDDLLRYFHDPRYIKIGNCPVIVIYRPAIIEQVQEMGSIWREKARAAGFDDLLLVATNSFGFDDPEALGFDAMCEFPPHNVSAPEIQASLTLFNSAFDGRVFSYDAVVDFSLERLEHFAGSPRAQGYYPTVMTGWDNEARKPGHGNVFHGADPARFHRWLEGACRFSAENHAPGEGLVFINAWNEWAEGTYLEPDRWFGYGYLNAVAAIPDALAPRRVLPVVLPESSEPVPAGRGAILVHAYYSDLVDELAAALSAPHLREGFDVFLTVPPHWSEAELCRARIALRARGVWITPNVGRDIYPFQVVLEHVAAAGYGMALKIHSKKSPHLASGATWRRSLLRALLTPEIVSRVAAEFGTDASLGMMAPERQFMPIQGELQLRDNRATIDRIAQRYRLDLGICERFVAGSMFWLRPQALARLVDDPLPAVEFGPELGAIDGTVAHAFERLFTTFVASEGFTVAGYATPDDFNPYT